MHTRFIALAVGLLLAAALVAGGAAAGGPQPLPQDQAAALVAGQASAGPSISRSISGPEALAAASQPGAKTYVLPGLTPQQAVGLAFVPGSTIKGGATIAASESTACSANAQSWTWGTWPYEQRLTDTTYWCAVPGVRVTYYSSTVNATGTLCGSAWTTSQLISGGIGYSWFVLRSSAGWNCPTVVPYITLHPSHHIDVSRNAWGSTEVVGSG